MLVTDGLLDLRAATQVGAARPARRSRGFLALLFVTLNMRRVVRSASLHGSLVGAQGAPVTFEPLLSSGINRAILAQRNFEGYRRRRLLWRTGWRGALRNFAITAAQAAAVAMLVQEVAPRVDAGAVVQEAVDMVLDRYEDAKERVLGTRRPPALISRNVAFFKNTPLRVGSRGDEEGVDGACPVV